MLITYVTKKNSKQILDILTSVLNFTESEKEMIGISGKSSKWSWFSSYFIPKNNQNEIPGGKKII